MIAKEKHSVDAVKADADMLEYPDWNVDAEMELMERQLAEADKIRPWLSIEVNFTKPEYFTWLLVVFASMGGLLSGLDQSLISGANLYMPRDLHLDSNQSSLVDSSMPLGAVAGALLLSPVNEWVGRRNAIMVACFLYTVGAALEAGAISFGMMIAGRLVLGAGLGLEGGTVPVYVAECVSSRLRGRLVSLYQFNIALGEVLGYAVAAIFINVKAGWRYILGSSLVFSTIMWVGLIYLPESPRYLMHKGKTVEAYAIWKRIRDISTSEAKIEFFSMKQSAEEERAEESKAKGRMAWLDFFTVPRCRRALVYANIMIFLGQFTGVNAILYYMSVLMNQIGFSETNSVFMSLVGGGALLLGTIPALFWVDKTGRRFWAIATLPGFFIGLLLVGFSYLIPIQNLQAAEGVYITGMILYMGFFGSYACLTWVIPAEVYPTYLRSYGMTTSDAMLFLCAFIVTYNFTRMQDAMTKIGLALGFYGGIAVLGWFYQILFMPETKDMTLEEIDIVFSQPTGELVKQNLRNSVETIKDLAHFRFRKVAFGEESEKPKAEESQA
ncbi:general substrate transporter [Lipomyces kononenkoae]|uniref:General substrate transporter n=1 Tax=Lipomyces kononenkoae TaxID=34357 RepID=A0ACC3TBB6_LIPKO